MKFQLPMVGKSGEDACEKRNSVLCAACVIAWGGTGLLILVGLLLKLVGLI